MRTFNNKSITVETKVNVPVDKVWKYWTEPRHITGWYFATDDWHAPFAENDLRVDGKFKIRMSAKNDSNGFDFEGIYNKVILNHCIDYTLADGRKVGIHFIPEGDKTKIEEIFEAEDLHSHELQKGGWQAILDNFKKYAESTFRRTVLHFEVTIQAPPQKVYTTMIDKNHYVEWTAAFSTGSRYEGSWEKCSKILFLGEGQDGKTGGMVSHIRENLPFRYISIEHRGIIQDGEEVTSGKEFEDWQGATENYTFERKNGGTLLSIDMDARDEFRDYFSETWPKALEILKDICERNGKRRKSQSR